MKEGRAFKILKQARMILKYKYNTIVMAFGATGAGKRERLRAGGALGIIGKGACGPGREPDLPRAGRMGI